MGYCPSGLLSQWAIVLVGYCPTRVEMIQHSCATERGSDLGLYGFH